MTIEELLNEACAEIHACWTVIQKFFDEATTERQRESDLAELERAMETASRYAERLAHAREEALASAQHDPDEVGELEEATRWFRRLRVRAFRVEDAWLRRYRSARISTLMNELQLSSEESRQLLMLATLPIEARYEDQIPDHIRAFPPIPGGGRGIVSHRVLLTELERMAAAKREKEARHATPTQ